MNGIRLETFERAAAEPDQAVMADGAYLEEQKLAAYEQGYKAGWEDASATDDQDLRALQLAVSRNLQALSFTHHEARSYLLHALQPLIECLTDAILPDLAQQALLPVLQEEVTKAAERCLGAPLTLYVHPSAHDLIQNMFKESGGLPVRIVNEPSLMPEQVLLWAADGEARVDLSETVARIRTCLHAHFNITPPGDQP